MAKTIAYKMVDNGRRQTVFDVVKSYCKKEDATAVVDFAMEVTAAMFNSLMKEPLHRIDIMPEIVGEDGTGLDGDEIVIEKTLLLDFLETIHCNAHIGFDFDLNDKVARKYFVYHQMCAQVRSIDGVLNVEDSLEVSRLIRVLQGVGRETD